MPTPVVTIFVRHAADCRFRDDETFKQCRCRKHLRWSHAGEQYRKSAKARSWSEAEKAKRRVEEQFDSGRTPEQAAAAAVTEDRKTLETAVQTFVAGKANQGLTEKLVNKFKLELARLERFMSKRSRFFPAEMTLEDLEAYRSTWPSVYKSGLTQKRVQNRLNEFLRYCYDEKLIDRVPRLKPIKADGPPTLPLEDSQYETLLKHIPDVFKNDQPSQPKRVHALIQLMRHSGLAIRDAVTLERDELQHDAKKKLYRVVTSRQKTGTHVSVPIPDDIAKELLTVLNGNPRYFFWTGNGKEESAVTDWQTDLRKLFRAAFPIPKDHPRYCKCHPRHPHQLRDTFAVNLLKDGVPLEEVSKLLGHTSIVTTERSYAPWVQSRQDRLDSLVTATWKKRR